MQNFGRCGASDDTEVDGDDSADESSSVEFSSDEREEDEEGVDSIAEQLVAGVWREFPSGNKSSGYVTGFLLMRNLVG